MYMKNRTTYFYLSPTIDCFFNLQICFLFNRNRMNQGKKNFLEYQHFCLKKIFYTFLKRVMNLGEVCLVARTLQIKDRRKEN